MSLRSYDLIIFGATGTIGKLITKYIHRHQLFPKWAILGRNHQKLSQLMNELVEMGGSYFPDILIADAQDIRNLRDIFLESRLLLNCLNPLSLYRDVIEACIMARCDYVDICPDVNFIQQSFLEFENEATKKGVTIMHGFDFEGAIPDLGVSLAKNISGNGACQLVESFLKVISPNGYTHRPLIDSIVSHSKNRLNINSMREKIEDKFQIPPIKHPGAKVSIKSAYFDERIGCFVTPSLGTETYLIPFSLREHCLRHHQTTQPQYHSYLASDTYLQVTGIAMHTAMLQSMSGYSLGRTLVRSFPEFLTEGVLSRRFPTQEQIESSSFEMTFISKGFMKTVATPYDSEIEDCGNPLAMKHERCMSEISDIETSSRFSRSGYVMTANRSIIDANVGAFPCTFLTRPRSRSRYILTEATMNTAIVKWIRVTGPDPYYGTTVILAARLIQFYLLHKRDQANLLNKTLPIGGVFTPSNVFHRLPTVFDFLSDYGIDFHISSDSLESDDEMQINSLQKSLLGLTKEAQKQEVVSVAAKKLDGDSNSMLEAESEFPGEQVAVKCDP